MKNIKNYLKTLYRKEQFNPGFIGLFINPFYNARKGLYASIVNFSDQVKGDLLDVGCGRKPYSHLFSVNRYDGLDIDNEFTRSLGIADYYYDGTEFPIESSKYDTVLCNQVLEHVFNPDYFLSEINRVLKPNGSFLLTIPFVWDEHEQPYDYARYSSFGIKAILEKNGFKIIKQKKISGDFSLIFQLVNAYLYKIFLRYPAIIRIFLTVTIMALINILGVILSKILPKNPDLFLDQIILAEKQK